MTEPTASQAKCLECGRALDAEWSLNLCPACIWEADPLSEEIPANDDDALDWVRRVIATLRQRPLPADRYEWGGVIRRGGQGEIVKVRDLWLKRDLALKRLRPKGDNEMPEILRFLQEAQISSQLRHPGILPVFDLGLDPEGMLFYTTLLLPGLTFEQVVDPAPNSAVQPWPLPRALGALVRICETVDFAHSHGVLHRDLTPRNVLLGGFDDLYVIDWGSACALGPPETARLRAVTPSASSVETTRSLHLRQAPDSLCTTGAAGFPGTLAYLPPEILRGDASALGPRVDVYAVGVILYRLLTHSFPYEDRLTRLQDPDAMRRAVLKGPPTPARDRRPEVAVPLAAICQRALAHDPAERYPSMTALADDLRAFLELRVVSAYETGRWAELKMLVRRNRGVFIAAGLALGGLAVAGWLLTRAHFREQVAAQTVALRNAQLHARSGQWDDALTWLTTAAQAGYADPIDLALQRIDAYTALNRPADASRELSALKARPQWGARQGDVLIKLAEHELFERGAWEAGLDHARAALALTLRPADEVFARGLLASNTPAALASFEKVLELDPYRHGAHVHSLGLELLMGQQERLNAHLALLRTLYPQDPSPVFVQGLQAALRGELAEARRLVAPYRTAIPPAQWSLLDSGFELLGESIRFFDTEQMLGPDMSLPPHLIAFATRCLAVIAQDAGLGHPASVETVRMPQLPCIRQGLREGAQAIVRLALAPVANPEDLLRQIQRAHEIHPEALLPLLGAYALEGRRPNERQQLRRFVIRQIQFYELAAQSPTLIPTVHRSARLLAALNQFELAQQFDPPEPLAREGCLANLRWFVNRPPPTPTQIERCYRYAFQLGDLDLARQFMAQWETLVPDAPELPRRRVELELATGAYGEALRRLERMLAHDPNDAWALGQRSKALEQLGRLARTGA